jgi:8-oxo-dGTP pyrophosphatase MutT (NUDIX family)
MINLAAVIVLINDGLVLGVSRRNDKTKFGLAGGKRDPGELIDLTAVRELREETGLIVDPNRMYYIYSRVEPAEKSGGEDFNCECFYAISWTGKITPEKGLEVKWVPMSVLIDPKTAAFAEYNKNTFDAFNKLFPKVYKTLK